MGKVVGMIGSASGKIGNVVYAVTNGIQTARVYQPIVANPKSVAQNLQRAKANLVGRLSAITPREAILGLGVNNRRRRAAFLSNGLRNATATQSGDEFTAKLEPSAVVFSKGAVIPIINVTAVSLSGVGSLTVTYSRADYVDQNEWAISGGYWVVVAIDPVDGNYDFVKIYNWAKGSYPSSSVESITQSIGVEMVAGHEVYVYFVPFSLNSTASSTTTEGLAIDASAYVAQLGLSNSASTLNFGNSKFLGEATQS